MGRWLAAIAWLCLALPGWAAELLPLPPLTARVTDLTGTLAAGQVASLEASLAAIEAEKGAQVAILLLPTTRPETIEDFGIRLAEAWKVGRRGVNDGVIVVVAKDDRKMRIEVGYGLEGAIPDALAKRIVAETMAPRFRQGDFAGGLEAAVADLAKLIRGEALPVPAAVTSGASGSHGGGDQDGAVVMLFLVVGLAAVLRAMLGLVGSLAASAVAGWLAWSLFASWIAVTIAAVAAFLFSFARGSGGGVGGSSGGGSWNSSDSGGFSGGGGDFGGGGASGDW
jgi:uncharacterized protein